MDKDDARNLKKRSRAETFGDAISEDGNDEFEMGELHTGNSTPAASNASSSRRQPTMSLIDIAAIRNGFDPSVVAQQMDRLRDSVISDDAVSSMAMMLEGYGSATDTNSASGASHDGGGRRRNLRRRVEGNTSNSQSDVESVNSRFNVEADTYVPNRSIALSEVPGFRDDDDVDFVQSMVNALPGSAPNPVQDRSRQQNGQDRYEPSRYAQRNGRNFNNGSNNSTRRGGANAEAADIFTVDPAAYTSLVPGAKEDLLLFDAETIPMSRALLQLAVLKKMHTHWQKKLRRASEEDVAGGGELLVRNGKSIIKRTSSAAFLLLIELFREVNLDELESAGVLAVNPHRLPSAAPTSNHQRIRDSMNQQTGLSQQSPSSPGANADAAVIVAGNNEPISLAGIEAAVIAQKKKLYSIWDELINRTPKQFTSEHRIMADKYWGELVGMIGSCFSLVTAFYSIHFLNSQTIAKQVLEFKALTIEGIKMSERLKFKLFICRKLSALNLRRGPSAGYLYMQHFINGEVPSHYWIRNRKIVDFIQEIISPVNGMEIMEIHAYACDQVTNLALMVDKGDPNLFPVVKPARGLYGFTNGILDMNICRFYALGTPSYLENITNSLEYKYVYNFFDGPFNGEGFSPIDGKLDWTERLAPFNAEGKPDWANPERMPAKHWTRKLRVPILHDTIKTQKWDLHTIAIFWFGLGRLFFDIGDNFQFLLFFKGVPGTGKSTILQFAIIAIPMEYRAVIPANGEAVFGLQQLIKDDKFVKHLGVITDMNGKSSIPTSQFNVLVTGEEFTTPDKFNETKTAKADMPIIIAGNQFFKDGPDELPSKIRRCVQFVLNATPNATSSTGVVNTASIVSAMPDYLRMVCEVYHEFFLLREMSSNDRYKYSTNIWEYVSPYLKDIRLESMTTVSGASRFIADSDWLERTNDENHFLSLKSLRFATDLHRAWDQGLHTKSHMADRKTYLPNEETVHTALTMIHQGIAIEQFGTLACQHRFEGSPEVLLNGVKCQLGDVVDGTNSYVVGLRIKNPEYLNFLLENMPHNKSADGDSSSSQRHQVVPSETFMANDIRRTMQASSNGNSSNRAPHVNTTRTEMPPPSATTTMLSSNAIASNNELSNLGELMLDMEDEDF